MALPLASIVAGCGTNSAAPNTVAPRPGVITGTAAMCGGPGGMPPHLVQARLLQGKRLIAHQTYLGNDAFRFSVAPGRYTVTSDQSYAVPVHVIVRSGEEVHADVDSICS